MHRYIYIIYRYCAVHELWNHIAELLHTGETVEGWDAAFKSDGCGEGRPEVALLPALWTLQSRAEGAASGLHSAAQGVGQHSSVHHGVQAAARDSLCCCLTNTLLRPPQKVLRRGLLALKDLSLLSRWRPLWPVLYKALVLLDQSS